MRTNPISDALNFLTQDGWTTYVFWLLTIASTVIAAINLCRDPSQRSVPHLRNWLARFFIGAMWWQWKLPPTYTDNPDGSGGLRYWMEEMAKWASTGLQQHFVKEVVLPHFYFFAPQVYFSEVLIAFTLMLGVAQPVGSFRRNTDGHQSLAGSLSFPCRVALDLLLPRYCPDYAPGSTIETQFGLGCYPPAT
jgi:hypothetical protein